MNYVALATRIEEAHDSLTDRPQDMFLRLVAGTKWLIETTRYPGAMHFGRFTRAVDPRYFADCCYAALNELRPA